MAMALLCAAKSQDLTQNATVVKNTSTEAVVKNNAGGDAKGNVVGDPAIPASPKPVYKIVGTDLVKVDEPPKLENEAEVLYQIYTDKGSSSSYRRKKFKDTTVHSADPFAWGDFSWMNGMTRKTSAPAFDSKYFTGDVTFDLNYTYSFANPIDNTVVGSTALSRNNELQLSFAGFGGDIHYGNVRGRIMMQFGTRATVVPRNDGSSYKGQYDLQTIYRYISEAYAGYHWDKWHGINLDAGIFMSYIGLFSYNNFENWGYQPSYTSDNTPWFFNGLRLQTFPTDRLKLELWLINGWQSYGTFNNTPGYGASIYWRPKEHTAWVFNHYYGHDDAGQPTRSRFHFDYSFLKRYYNNPKSKFITKAAYSITMDFGGENGGGVRTFVPHPTEARQIDQAEANAGQSFTALVPQNFISGMIYNRIWFGQKLAWTFGGGYMHNPGQYLVLSPTGYADSLYLAQNGNPGSTFDAWDCSTTFEWDVNQNLTWKLEFVHRKEVDFHAAPGSAIEPGTNSPDMVGYFAGRGGVTGPSGFQFGSGYTYTSSGAAVAPAYFGPNGLSNSWHPDLRNVDNRIIMALLVRF